MAKQNKITAQWVSEWIEIADQKLARATYELAPFHFFGDQFHVTELADSPVVDDITPRRATATATVSRRLFRIMLRYQAGSEALGDDPADWALVEGSAVDADTGSPVDPHSV